MSITVTGIYRNGVIQLLDVPEELREGLVTVTLSQTEEQAASRPGLWYGKYSEGRMSTEEDFKIAEWPGDREVEL
jgi:hypothetical protein